MGLTTSLFTALSGLNTNSQGINVAGNNIANVNTTAYKSNRALFETQIADVISQGTGPTGQLGGTNSTQIGLGTRLASVQRNMNDGSIQTTGINTDLAIEGSGFYVLKFGSDQRYSRAGAFSLDSNFNLVDPNGGLLQGFGVDEQFNVVEGVMENIVLPIGAMTVAEETRSVQFNGNLNASGDVATRGSIITSNALNDASTGLAATRDTLLTDLRNANDPLTQLFQSDDIVSFTGAKKGQVFIADRTFAVSATSNEATDGFGTTFANLVDFLDAAMGIDQSADPNAGVTVNANGQMVVTGNTGEVNDIILNSANLVVDKSGNATLPFSFTKDSNDNANGESVRTSFAAFDSLGTPLRIDVSIVLEDKSNTGTTWRYYVQSEDDTDLDLSLGTGTLHFDTRGQLVSDDSLSIFINRDNTGAATPQPISLQFSNGDGSISALTDIRSEISAIDQDGVSTGTLEDFSIGEDGTIIGKFSNSLERTLGRVVLATFTNPLGLVEKGSNLFTTSANSGSPSITTPLSGGAGRTINGALELSNVDLSQEFINLVIYSTGFSASSRVLTTSNQLIQELLATIR